MGVYSNTEIKAAVQSGQIVFEPYREENINGSSVDVTLGKWFYRTAQEEEPGKPQLFNPYDSDDIARYFGKPFEALPLREHTKIRERLGISAINGVPENHPVVILRPNERLLAHTDEFIGIHPPGTTSIHARSTIGRDGVVVCMCADWGGPGYINRWALEIKNVNEHEYVPLAIGERVAQIVFEHTGPVESEYAELSGHYQSGNDIEEIKRLWTPSQMLPKPLVVPELPSTVE